MATQEEKQRSRYLTSEAIRKGTLVRLPCEKCGAVAESHHEDYSKPLEITWLCRKHHVARHMELGGWGCKPNPDKNHGPNPYPTLVCPCCDYEHTLDDPEILKLVRKVANTLASRAKRPGSTGNARNPYGRKGKPKEIIEEYQDRKPDAWKETVEEMEMTYADARYEVLNMGIGMTKIVDGQVITRWSAEAWEVGTHGKYTADLTSTLSNLGHIRPEEGGPGAMVADYQQETGCDWSTALARCNCD